jgi:hypothetical protein
MERRDTLKDDNDDNDRDREVKQLVNENWQEKLKYSGKTYPVPLCPPQIPP